MLTPFFWLISSSLKAPYKIFVFPPQLIPDPVQWQNYAELFEAVPVMGYTMNTLIITFLAGAGSVFSAALAGYSFARLRFRGRDFMFALNLAMAMVPFVVLMIPVYILFTTLGWVGTFWPLIIPHWFAGPVTTFMLRQFFRTIPMELEDAARIDGASRPRIFFQIILPLSKPALAVAAVLAFLYHWNDFLMPLIYLQKRDMFTLALALNSIQYYEGGQDWTHYVMALGTVMILPVVAIYFFSQRVLLEGIVLTGLKG
jgi:ABC-type glycerol-3-phosphate transport system permease component